MITKTRLRTRNFTCAAIVLFAVTTLSACGQSPEDFANLTAPVVYSLATNAIKQGRPNGDFQMQLTFNNLQRSPDGWPAGQMAFQIYATAQPDKVISVQYILNGSHVATAIVDMPGEARTQLQINLYESAIILGQAANIENHITSLAQQLKAGLNSSHRIVVFDFENSNGEEIAFGRQVAESLITNLSKSQTVLERRLLSNVVRELKFQDSGLTAENARKELGRFLGANAVTIGTIKLEKEEVVINGRTVDLETGVVLSSGQTIIPKYLIAKKYIGEM